MKTNIETDYLIFVSSDGKKNGYDIFNDRIKKNLWPIYVKTPQLINVKIGKKIIFYIAGNSVYSQHFVATGKIEKLENLKTSQNFVSIKKHIKKLSFIEISKRKIYGLYFQGGVCKINKQSYDYIIKNSLINQN